MAEDLKPHLRNYLLTNPELTALVGSRIYWDEAPQDSALPFVFLRRQGSSAGIDQFDLRDSARVEVICEAGTREEGGSPRQATTVYLAVDDALHRRQNYNAGTLAIRHSMRSGGPNDDVNRLNGRPQVVAYFTVRY